jgi:hypothetical protein
MNMNQVKTIKNPEAHKGSFFSTLLLLVFDKLLYRPFWAFWIIAFVGTTMMYNVDTLGIWLSEPAKYIADNQAYPSLIVLDGMHFNTDGVDVDIYQELQKRLHPVEYSVMTFYGTTLICVGLAFYVVYIAYFFYLLRFFRHIVIGFAFLSFFFVGCSFWPKNIVKAGYETVTNYGRSDDVFEGPIGYAAWYITYMDYITVNNDLDYERTKLSYHNMVYTVNLEIDYNMSGSNKDKLEQISEEIRNQAY